MNLIWVPNQQFALYFLAFCRQYSVLGDYSIFVQDEIVIPELNEFAEEMNIKFVDRNYATTNCFEYFVMFSWGILSYQEEVRISVDYKKLLLFGDGFNNTMFLDSSARNWDIYGLIFFGYELIDETFKSMDLPNVKNKYIISIESISNCVIELQNRCKIANHKDVINDECFLILDRYWGAEPYLIKEWHNFEKYIEKVFSYTDENLSIVYKKVEHGFSNTLDEIRQNVVIDFSNTRYLDWESVVEPKPDFRYLTSPEALFLGDRIEPKVLFAFDGSTSLIGKIMQSGLSIVWPDIIEIAEVFYYPHVAELVKEKSNFYRETICKWDLNKNTPVSATYTSGQSMRELINRFILDHYEGRRDALTQERDALTQERDALTQERDALTQERDALTQERDALTQERDALTQERDALTQERDELTQERDAIISSYSWRITRMMRGGKRLLRRAQRVWNSRYGRCS